MKYLRNILSVLLSFSLCFSLVVPAFAETIHCPNSPNGNHHADDSTVLDGVVAGNGKRCAYCIYCKLIVWRNEGGNQNQNGWHDAGLGYYNPNPTPPCEHKDPETGESWLKEETTKNPTCTQPGSKTISCTHCDYEKIEQIKALGHDYEGTTWTDACGSTCNHAQIGSHVKQCQRSNELCTTPHDSQTAPHTYPTIADDEGWADYTGTDHGLTLTEGQTVQKRDHMCTDCGHIWYEFRAVDPATPPQPGTYTVVVNYQDDEGNVLQQPYSETINVGTAYDVSAQKNATITKDGVTYNLSNGDTVIMSGTSGTKDQTVTITLVYTADPGSTTPVEANYIVKWVDEDGNPIKAEETRTGTIGTTVEATPADKSITDYEYVSGSSTESAELLESGTELILVFKQSTPPQPGTYTLTVSHIYRNAQGNVVRQTSETSDATYHSGDSYTTTDRSRTGFTLSGRPANASGTFGSANITVTYYYDAEPVPPEETVRTTPENPNQNQPAEEIPEPEIPLAEVPIEDDVEIPEPEIPLAETPEEIEIEEPAVPLADVPQTGDGISLWYVTAAVSALGLTLLLITGKKKEQEI